MPPFTSKPLNASSSATSTFLTQIRRHPFILFGLPFVGIIVGSSFALSEFTQTRYDYQQSRVRSMDAQEELGMRGDRRKVDLKEEYYRLNAPIQGSPDSALDASLNPNPASPSSSSSPESSTPAAAGRQPKRTKSKFSMTPLSQDDYEPVRVPRPEGVPEWGGVRAEEAPIKGQRAADRWV
ncbi:cytochrome c oxidase-assembly factor COX16 [Kwoniella heveanensis CBS 569]|nr:cytochrome c oxidase-assembly factor COX16 [Kwoniella heveanensis CBS 569]